MNKTIEKEVLATLIKAGRKDLAEEVVSAREGYEYRVLTESLQDRLSVAHMQLSKAHDDMWADKRPAAKKKFEAAAKEFDAAAKFSRELAKKSDTLTMGMT